MTRLLQRGISLDNVSDAIKSGEIIENYPDDYPYPSCLILGRDKNAQALHVVCGVAENELWLITAYRPSPEIWEDDLGAFGKIQQVTVIFPPDFVVAHSTYRSTPSRLRLVIRKNSSSHNDFKFTNTL